MVIGMGRASSLLRRLVSARRSIYYCINHDSGKAFLQRLASLRRCFDDVVLIATNTSSELSPLIDQPLRRKFTTIPQFTEFSRGETLWNDAPANERLKVVFMGVLKPGKGVVEIASGWSTYAPAMSDLHIYGDGPQRSEIEAICRTCSNRPFPQETSKVIFHGSYSLAQRETALVAILKDADLLVLPTKTTGEGLPTVILEALCAGVPVVATHYGGVSSFSTRYYADLPAGVRLCDTETFMETVGCMIADIRAGRISRLEVRAFYQRHFSDDRIEARWRGVLSGGRVGESHVP